MQHDVIGDIQRLLECESPSTDADANARSADLVTQLGLEYLGTEPERIVYEGFNHLVWRWGEGAPRVMILGHHDTVWPLGSLETHPATVTDGVLRGPGCFDMKTGVVMALDAIAALDDRTGVTLLISGDEELGSPTSRQLIEDEARGCDAVFVLEASADGGAIKTERKGVSLYTLTVRGRAAHAGLDPESGISATVEIAHQVLAVAALADPVAGTTVTPTVMTSGTTTNTVPALATVSIDVRAWTAAEQARVDSALRALSGVIPGAVVEISGSINRSPLELQMSEGLFQRARGLAQELDLGVLTEAAVGGASDGNFTAGIGVPTLDGLGAVGGGAHADHEHVIVAEIAPRTRLLTALVADILNSPSSTVRNTDSAGS